MTLKVCLCGRMPVNAIVAVPIAIGTATINTHATINGGFLLIVIAQQFYYILVAFFHLVLGSYYNYFSVSLYSHTIYVIIPSAAGSIFHNSPVAKGIVQAAI